MGLEFRLSGREIRCKKYLRKAWVEIYFVIFRILKYDIFFKSKNKFSIGCKTIL